MARTILTKSPKATKMLAKGIIKKIKTISRTNQTAAIAFSGELGAGKTTLIQGLGELLGIRGKIQSPTFVIMRKYRIARKNLPWKNLIHIDAYRIKTRKEISALGLKHVFLDPKNLAVIEWPERVKSILPRQTIWIELKHRGGNHRHIIFKREIKNEKGKTKA